MCGPEPCRSRSIECQVRCTKYSAAPALSRLPHAPDFRVGCPPREPHPRLVGEHGPSLRARPQIEQHDVPRREAAIGSLVRLVVGHRARRPKGDNRPVVGPEPRPLDRLEHPGLHTRLAHPGPPRPTHPTARRAPPAGAAAPARGPVSPAGDQRAAKRETRGADDTSRAPRDSSSSTTPCGTRSKYGTWSRGEISTASVRPDTRALMWSCSSVQGP